MCLILNKVNAQDCQIMMTQTPGYITNLTFLDSSVTKIYFVPQLPLSAT